MSNNPYLGSGWTAEPQTTARPRSMSHLKEQMTENAPRNQELLYILGQTEYAPPALKQCTAYVADLRSQIAATEKELARLHKITEDERKDHIKYKDSTVKRFAHKMGGHKGQAKFQSKMEKEEREFLEAWQREREAKERREELEAALTNAEGDQTRFTAEMGRHEEAQKELDAMYQAIFQGPTPELPAEDQMEDAVGQARSWFGQCQTTLGTEKRALEALEGANKHLQRGLYAMEDALSASRWDLMGGGGFADMMERDALSQAQNWLSQGLRQHNDARRAQPAIHPLTDVNIDHGHFISDVLFDNIFTDMAQHDRITSSAIQMQKAYKQLQQQLPEQARRVKESQSTQKQALQQVEAARKELQDIRSEAFGRLQRQGTLSEGQQYEAPDGPPPEYPPGPPPAYG